MKKKNLLSAAVLKQSIDFGLWANSDKFVVLHQYPYRTACTFFKPSNSLFYRVYCLIVSCRTHICSLNLQYEKDIDPTSQYEQNIDFGLAAN